VQQPHRGPFSFLALERVFTVGVYGADAERFFAALVDVRPDVFCDLRARRAVRGHEYAFANARRLEARLPELGIPYRHFPELAPAQATRDLQHAADAAAGVAVRARTELVPGFVAAYERQLEDPSARTALETIRSTTTTPVLFCVERTAAACHRSLVAARLAGGSIPVDDLLP